MATADRIRALAQSIVDRLLALPRDLTDREYAAWVLASRVARRHGSTRTGTDLFT